MEGLERLLLGGIEEVRGWAGWQAGRKGGVLFELLGEF
jgi:hypothetical protein